MKKFFYFLATVSILAVACSKEDVVNETINTDNAGGKVTLTASMPVFSNADTKASVTDGVFSWTADDVIDVVYEKAGSPDKTYAFECTNASTGEFTNVDAIDDGYTIKTSGSVAFYPHEYDGSPTNQTFDSPASAAKGFQMHATYDAGKLKFVHDNAMMKVTVTNVPSFAKELVIGSAKVNLSYADTQASVTYYVPVLAAAEAKLSIAVMDGATPVANDIYAKSSKNASAISAAHYYELPTLNINRFVVFNNSNDSTHKLGIQGRTLAEGWNSDWKVVDLKTDGTVKYYVLEDRYQSAEALQLALRQNDGGDDYNKSEASFVVNDRNFIFDISENSLKTAYRTYLKVNLTTYWGDGIGANIIDQYNEPKSYTAMTSTGSDNFWYYEWPVSYYGYGMYIRLQNKSNTEWYLPGSDSWWTLILNRDFIYNYNG